MKKFLAIILIVSFSFVMSGCALLDWITGTQNDLKIQETPLTSVEEAKKSEKIIKEYLEIAYRKPLKELTERASTGNIPEDLIELIYSDVLAKGINNKSINIHLPRMINFAGYNTVEYELLKNSDGTTRIDVDMYAFDTTKKEYAYYVKVYLKARVVTDSSFDSYFDKDPVTFVYKQKAEIQEADYDTIKLSANYDVEVKQVEDKYSLLKLVEASELALSDQRLNIYNNTFMNLLPYLEESIASDKKIIDPEKRIIEKFFKKLYLLKYDDYQLLESVFNEKSDADYLNQFVAFGISESEKTQLILKDELNFKSRFMLDDLPKKGLVEKFDTDQMKIQISVSPKYLEKQKYYKVKILVQGFEIGIGAKTTNEYSYNYEVNLENNANGNPLVKHIKLESFEMLRPQLMEQPAVTSEVTQ